MIAALLAIASATAVAPAVHCGAVERPGIAERGEDGVWRGAAVDLCRTIAVAQSRGTDVEFRAYRTAADLRDAARDTLAVLSPAELALAGPGVNRADPRVIATSRQLLLVRDDSRLHDPVALAGRRVCFIVASEAEGALDRWVRRGSVAIARVGFQEPGELRDALDAGYCAAMAVDAADIPDGDAHTKPLGPPLAELPLFAVRQATAPAQHGASAR